MTSKADKQKNASRFATVLRRLLDESGIYTRAEWAEFLDVRTAAISQWVHDRTIPTPENLSRIIGELRIRTDVSKELMDQFDELAVKPSVEVTPLGHRCRPTIAHYMLQPALAGLARGLSVLSLPNQEIVVARAVAHCSELERLDPISGTARSLRIVASEPTRHVARVISPVDIDLPPIAKFSMHGGSVRLVAQAGAEGETNLESEAQARQFIAQVWAQNGPQLRPVSSKNGPEAFVPLANAAHVQDVSKALRDWSQGEPISDRAGRLLYRTNGLIMILIATPAGDSYEVELLVLDDANNPITHGVVAWRNGNRRRKIAIEAGEMRLTSCKSGRLELTIEVRDQPKAHLAVDFIPADMRRGAPRDAER